MEDDTMNDGVLQKLNAADAAITVKLYDDIEGPASRVPLSHLLAALCERDRLDFEAKFLAGIRAGLFDDTLEFLSEGEWASLKSADFKRIEKGFDPSIVRDVYILMASLPLATLQKWAAKFEAPLPRRFHQNPDGDRSQLEEDDHGKVHPAALNSDAGDGIEVPKSPPNRGGRPSHPDKERMFNYARELILSGEYASKEDRSQTKLKFVEAVHAWMKVNAFKKYRFGYLEKLLQPLWRETRHK